MPEKVSFNVLDKALNQYVKNGFEGFINHSILLDRAGFKGEALVHNTWLLRFESVMERAG